MVYEEHFAQVPRQHLSHKQTLLTPSGLSIRSNGTSGAGFHEAFKGEHGTELVIGEHSDVEIAFEQEVDSLLLEYYVVSDRHFDDVRMLLDTDGYDVDLIAPTPRDFYWLTLSGSGYTEFLPGPLATQPYHQVIGGPFRRLTISTSQAGTVHIRKLEWTRTCRH
ncbi:hypothetical protein ACU5P1_02155 [Pseudomonas plecoglossicida]|uniref:Uncharacterized protein n=1 Tax=Pseudomonas plecoglossicida TaxID=70775 RepID=A0AAD0QWG7_PSEDL|nr:hypothetical protein [Pseudomonas plecoglossicida]AXM96923.1 hypothetical protein DVB73_14605 [Pseudomonas plecoglossicida]EPB93655.1 hypothetical protein L321_22832 [Pseudomonas plecoglossicida NB2011]QLB53703.1 hypothetical protein HAV28_02145 [Pseudomonas plecoglossicida]GLR36302.1 hypothetical protein GCM10011247_16990 [Pseudomonas plecoglossicida]